MRSSPLRSILAALSFTWVVACGAPPFEELDDAARGRLSAPNDCVVSGCSGEICADTSWVSTCEARPEAACYQTAACERQADGACGWTMDAALTSCLASHAPDAGDSGDQDGGSAPGPCVVSGCSGQLCADEALPSTCEWKDAYACYASATCERQADGACGWTMDAALTACLAANP